MVFHVPFEEGDGSLPTKANEWFTRSANMQNKGRRSQGTLDMQLSAQSKQARRGQGKLRVQELSFSLWYEADVLLEVLYFLSCPGCWEQVHISHADCEVEGGFWWPLKCGGVRVENWLA